MSTIPAHMINEVITTKKNVLEPVVGMLGTYFVGSDRYAVVVKAVNTPKKIKIKRLYDFDKNRDAYTDENNIEYYAHDLNSNMCDCETYTLRKNGRWMPMGYGLWDCGAVHLGKAEPYLDPSF